jgi:hypothetical protein
MEEQQGSEVQRSRSEVDEAGQGVKRYIHYIRVRRWYYGGGQHVVEHERTQGGAVNAAASSSRSLPIPAVL